LSPFYSVGYGLAWNTNGTTTVESDNVDDWSKLLDAGDRHLFRARGAKPETVFLDAAPAWTSSTLAVPVTVDATAGGRTLEVYASRSPDAWYFEDRWEKKVTVGTVAAGASLKTATFTGIDGTTNWYVSARLRGSGYDEWTDPVLFEPPSDDGGFAAPELATLEDGGHVPLSFGKDSSNNPTFEITIKNAVKDAYYTVYAAEAVGGPYAAVKSEKADDDGLKTLAIPATAPTRFVRIGVGKSAVADGTPL
jgi:hypothetical protein